MVNNNNKIFTDKKIKINAPSQFNDSSRSLSLQTAGTNGVLGNKKVKKNMPSVSGSRKHITLKTLLSRKTRNLLPLIPRKTSNITGNKTISRKNVLPVESLSVWERYLISRINPYRYKQPGSKWVRKLKLVPILNNNKKKQWLLDQQLIRKLYRYPYLLYHILKSTNQNILLKYYLHFFLWQSRHFLHFLTLHPELFNRVLQSLHTISLLKSLDDQHKLELFLTQFWIHFFDHFQLYRKNRWKWKGIRIRLSGRLGFRKMGRARRQLWYWGETRMSGAIYPLQYSYSQIKTRYGVIGMRIAIH